MVSIEIINTGTELMLGRVLNTHQQWLCRQLADHGYEVTRQVAVPDTGPAIRDAVRDALQRADWVLTTGGLGPTSDDLTRDLVAQLLGLKLRQDAVVLERLQRFYADRCRPMPTRVEIQAQVPEGARVLLNHHGTAPGLVIELRPNPMRTGQIPGWLAMLPGPPRELRPMFTEQLLPLLLAGSPLDTAWACRTLRTTGQGESQLEERINTPLQPLLAQGLDLGYCARPGEVDLRFSARGPQAEALVQQAAALAHMHVGEAIYGEGDRTLEQGIVELLAARQSSLAVAESCTGGLLAHRLTEVPGASAVFWGGWITYDNAAKCKELGVRPETLDAHGAVSEAVAREMAEGARARSGATFALAITGIAGPSGGTEDKPVGTVFIALAGPRETAVTRSRNVWDRSTFKQVTTQQALDLVRRSLLEK